MELIDQFEIQKECDYKDEHYQVRDNGAVLRASKEGKRIRSLDNQWTFGTKDNTNGYMTISGHRVHIIVATAFHGARDSKKFVVDHIDTNRCNNRPENLRWLTRLENILLNPITRAKIEYICGSVERFLSDPNLLRGHEHEDNNFSWMRTVSKEEAENTLSNWNKLISNPRPKTTASGSIGEWMYGKNGVPVTKIPEEIDAEERRKAEQEEERKRQKEEQKAAESRRRREAAEKQKQEEKEKAELIIKAVTDCSDKYGWTLQKKQKGQNWSCDILLTSGDDKIAIKVMKSGHRCEDELQAMNSEGIRGLWLGCKTNTYGQSLFPSFEVATDASELTVSLHDDEKVSIETFIKAFVERRVNVRDSIDVSAIKVRFVSQDCYKCGATHWIFLGLGCYEGDVFFAGGCDDFDPRVIHSVKKYLSENPGLGYDMGEIKDRHSNTRGESYLSFGCPKCDGIVGDWYLRDLFMEMIYEPDDQDVHRIELDEHITMRSEYWAIDD